MTRARPLEPRLPDGLRLRAARDEDSPEIVALIDLCFREYPGCVLDVEREEPELLSPSRSFPAFWVLVDDHRVVGTAACTDHRSADGDRIAELKKLYLHPSVRGRGVASTLVEIIEAWALDRDATAIELWSDTRFLTAHAVYEHLGYERTGRARDLHDLSDTREFHFVKRLAAEG